MSLPFGLLGLLKYKDSTGYELAKMFEDSLSNFWTAQLSQIYRELNRMEEKGWVVSHSVIQSDKPNKRVYSITGTGMDAFDQWLAAGTPLFENSHDPMLMRVFFGGNAPHVTLHILKSYRDMCKAGLDELAEHTQETIGVYQTAVPRGEHDSMYWQMTLDLGVAQTKATIQWAQACIDKLEHQLASKDSGGHL